MTLLEALLLKLTDSKYHVNCASVLSEATLTLWYYVVDKVLCESVEEDAGKQLACYAE